MGMRLGERTAPAGDAVWESARDELGPHDGDDSGDGPDVNIARLAITRHVRAGRGDATAIRWFGRDDLTASEPIDITYEMLEHRTNRFAGALRRHGIEPGAGVATVAGRLPEFYVAALGTLKADCVFTPLCSTHGPEPIAARLAIGEIRVLVTTPVLFRRTVAEILDRLPDLELVLVVGATEDSLSTILPAERPGLATVMSFGEFIGEGHDTFTAPPTTPDTPALVHFTNGTTGPPNGTLHVHGAVVAQFTTARSVLDLDRDDVYWCTADPVSEIGTSYGIVAPLVIGAIAVVDEAEFGARRCRRILASQSVDVFAAGPTEFGVLRRDGADTAPADFPALRLVASVGEPLDADSRSWARDAFGVPVLDLRCNTEAGAIVTADRSVP